MDPKYEFNCPVYVDFEAVLDGTEGEEDVDHWFSREITHPLIGRELAWVFSYRSRHKF